MDDTENGFEVGCANESSAGSCISESRPSTNNRRVPLSMLDCQHQIDRSKSMFREREVVDRTFSAMTEAFSTIIRSLGDNPERDGLRKTPTRAAKAFCYFTKGYEETVQGMLSISICMSLISYYTYYN